MDIMMYFLIAIVILTASFLYSLGAFRDEILKKMFQKKDLPVNKKVRLTKKTNIYFYDLKRKENGQLDRDNETYIKIAKIVNKDLEINIENGELVIDRPDYTDEAYKVKMIDIISMVTNFNYAQFIFHGEDKFKLYSTKTEIGELLKEHTMNIIDEVFVDIVKRIEEGVADSLHK